MQSGAPLDSQASEGFGCHSAGRTSGVPRGRRWCGGPESRGRSDRAALRLRAGRALGLGVRAERWASGAGGWASGLGAGRRPIRRRRALEAGRCVGAGCMGVPGEAGRRWLP